MAALNIENLNRLIAHLRTVAHKQFNMAYVFTAADGTETSDVVDLQEWGTAACIAGHCVYAMGSQATHLFDSLHASSWLGLKQGQYSNLFMPDGYEDRPEDFPLPRAIAVLCHLRDTGEVRWDLFPPERYAASADPRQPWSAPQASERPAPVLPETLTRLVRDPDLALVKG